MAGPQSGSKVHRIDRRLKLGVVNLARSGSMCGRHISCLACNRREWWVSIHAKTAWTRGGELQAIRTIYALQSNYVGVRHVILGHDLDILAPLSPPRAQQQIDRVSLFHNAVLQNHDR